MSEEIQERWATSEGLLENGLPCLIRYREDLPGENEKKKLSTLVVISWGYESEDGTGMPQEDELNQMEDFENLLDDALVEKGVARLMTVFTGDGVREWQFYTDDVEYFMKKFNEAFSGDEELPIEIDAFDDKNWDAYKDYVKSDPEE